MCIGLEKPNRTGPLRTMHAYYYGHHYLHQHLQAGDRYHVENMLVNGENIDTLVTQDAYPSWNGWYHPMQHDLVWIHILIQQKEER